MTASWCQRRESSHRSHRTSPAAPSGVLQRKYPIAGCQLPSPMLYSHARPFPLFCVLLHFAVCAHIGPIHWLYPPSSSLGISCTFPPQRIMFADPCQHRKCSEESIFVVGGSYRAFMAQVAFLAHISRLGVQLESCLC